MSDASYQPKVYRAQGGNELVVATGGTLTIEGTINFASGVSASVQSGGSVSIASGGSISVAAGGALALATGAKFTSGVITATASFTLGAEDSGLTCLIGAPNIVATLPSTAEGLQFHFHMASAGLSTGVGFKVKPAAADAINGNGLTSVDGNRLLLAGSGDREGDFVSVIGDGSDGWYIRTISGTWTKATS